LHITELGFAKLRSNLRIAFSNTANPKLPKRIRVGNLGEGGTPPEPSTCCCTLAGPENQQKSLTMYINFV